MQSTVFFNRLQLHFVKSDAKNNNTTISKTSEEEFRCSANSSQYCSYTWYSDGKNISESESLKANRSGLHVCKANCRMRGLTCLVTAGSFNVSGATTPEGMV